MPGRCRLFADSPPSTMMSINSAFWSLRNAFVALQMALSIVLLTLGLLFARSFIHLAGADPGFNIRGTVIVRVRQPPGQRQGEAGWVWRDRIAEIMKQVPGVTGVTSVGTLPLMDELQFSGLVAAVAIRCLKRAKPTNSVGASNSATFSAFQSCTVGISRSPIAPAALYR